MTPTFIFSVDGFLTFAIVNLSGKEVGYPLRLMFMGITSLAGTGGFTDSSP